MLILDAVFSLQDFVDILKTHTIEKRSVVLKGFIEITRVKRKAKKIPDPNNRSNTIKLPSRKIMCVNFTREFRRKLNSL